MSNVGENRTDDTNIENEVRLQQLAGVPVVDNDVDRAQEPLGYKKDEAGSSASGSDGTVKIEDEIPVEKPAVPDIGPPPDGGLTAWMQVLSNFLIHFLGVGFSNAFGVFVRYYYNSAFFGPNINQTSLALMGGTSQLISFTFGPVIGILSDRFGYMPVSVAGSVIFGVATIIAGFSHGSFAVAFIFQGVVQGVGFMACWIPSMGAVAQWFAKKRGLAMAIGGAGSGLGGLAMSSITQVLLERIGLQWTLLTLGCLMLALLIPSSLMIRTRMPPKRRGPVMDWSAFKSLKFVALWLACFICYFAFPLPLFFLPTYATQYGVAGGTAALILGVTNATSAPARIILGAVMDRIGSVNVFALACAVASIVSFALAPFAHSTGLLFAFAVLYGMSGGAFMTYLPICTTSLFGIQTAASKLGIIYLSLAVGAMLGTFVGGQLITAFTVKPADGGPAVTNWWPFWAFVGSAWAAGFMLLCWLKYLVNGWKIWAKV